MNFVQRDPLTRVRQITTMTTAHPIIEAELLLRQMAQAACRACAHRSRVVIIWDGMADGDAAACPRCNWRPLVVDVMYDALGVQLA